GGFVGWGWGARRLACFWGRLPPDRHSGPGSASPPHPPLRLLSHLSVGRYSRRLLSIEKSCQCDDSTQNSGANFHVEFSSLSEVPSGARQSMERWGQPMLAMWERLRPVSSRNALDR